jgi:KUP system potassium uptake protein
LFGFVCHGLWRWGLARSIGVCAVFGGIEMVFFASNALKIAHGGWLPLTIGAALFYLMTTWKMGRRVVDEVLFKIPLEDFIARAASGEAGAGSPPARVKGTAVFLTSSEAAAPAALVQNLKHNHVLHERTVILTIRTDHQPYRERDSRVAIGDFSAGFFQLTAHFGYMELPSVREIVECSEKQSFPIDMETTSFFLSGLNLMAKRGAGLPAWRKSAFIVMSRNAEKASQYFRLPDARTLEIDSPVEI